MNVALQVAFPPYSYVALKVEDSPDFRMIGVGLVVPDLLQTTSIKTNRKVSLCVPTTSVYGEQSAGEKERNPEKLHVGACRS